MLIIINFINANDHYLLASLLHHFISSVDHGTGGVTEIRTVTEATGGSSNSCLSALNAGSNSNIPIPLIVNTYIPAQCSVLTIQTNPPSAIRGFVPSGTPFAIDTRSGKCENMIHFQPSS
jgi:hypothetical protein